MDNLSLAISLEHPGKTNGIDYEVRDDGDGPFVAFWNLPGSPPKNQGEINKILRKHEDKVVDLVSRNEPDWPTIEERLEDVEQSLMEQGQSLPARERIEQVKERVRGRFSGGGQ